MRSSIIFSAITILAQQVAAQADSVDALSHGSLISAKMRRRADVNLNSGDYLKRNVEVRDASPSSSSAAPAASYTSTFPINLNPVMSDTESACSSALNGQNADQTGMIPCFNINYFDNSTGNWQANVLVYKLADPSGDWANVNGYNVSISWPNSDNVKKTNETQGNNMASATVNAAETPMRRTLSRRDNSPTLMESVTMTGQVTGNYANMLTNNTAMHEALMPNITLSPSGGNNNAKPDSPSVPSNAQFVNGWFSTQYFQQQSNFQFAQAHPAPFVLPGVTLGISKGLYPIGLIAVSIWTALFAIVVGWGTLGRLQWRRAYRAGKTTASGK